MDKFALYSLGVCYENGWGVEQDRIKAINFYRDAAPLGNYIAKSVLIDLSKKAIDMPLDYIEAQKLFAEASKQYDRRAFFYLLHCYDELGASRLETDSLISLYQQAAEKDNLQAILSLAYFYGNGHGVLKNPLKSFDLYQRAAQLGSPEGIHTLAFCYYYGLNVTKDVIKSIKLFQEAAELGEALALSTLGSFYSNGENLPKDKKKALECYTEAAELGEPTALLYLGREYELGRDVPKDKKKANELYIQAAIRGNLQAVHELGRCYEEGNCVNEPDYNRALTYYKYSASRGCSEGMYRIGLLYHNGLGVPRDLQITRYWLKKAADKGHKEAQIALEKSLSLSKRQIKKITLNNSDDCIRAIFRRELYDKR